MEREKAQAKRDEDPDAHEERLAVERENYRQAKRDKDQEAHDERLAVQREKGQG